MHPAEELLGSQNSDGGWGYTRSSQHGGSWTEPTCYALLALAAMGQEASPGATRGVQWLSRLQRKDGGFSPRQSVAESTWQTALALALPAGLFRREPSVPEIAGAFDRPKAEAWLLDQTGQESGWLNRVRLLLSGVRPDVSLSYDGWPWYPGTAAWVTPTALSILALERMARTTPPDPDVAQRIRMRIDPRIEQGRGFLLARRCGDGGWNHGSTKSLGYDSDSYPETTGMALLALRGITTPEVDRGLRCAEQHLANCKSREAAGWLTMGLLAHGRMVALPDLKPHGGTLETAVTALAGAALEGRNPFLL
jgi:Squalene-hopene cyclase C-terminal domain